jgi:hypothetical protein
MRFSGLIGYNLHCSNAINWTITISKFSTHGSQKGVAAMKVRIVLLSAMFALVGVLFAPGQETIAQTHVLVSGANTVVATLGPGSPFQTLGLPYSADHETETVQTLADGTHITTKNRSRMYRDSQGRTRTDIYWPDTVQAREGSQGPSMINILDPVEGVQYSLNPRTRTGRRNTFPVHPINPPPPSPEPAANVPLSPPPQRPKELMPQSKTEDLGMEMVEGVWTHHTKTTTTIPVNAEGNDRPMVRVFENWFSEDLKLMVLSKRSDPRGGETTDRLTNIDRSEPDPSLFVPPADYTITEPQR